MAVSPEALAKRLAEEGGSEDESDDDDDAGVVSEAKRRVTRSGWDWVYDEETVRQEQEELSNNITQSRAHFEKTTKSAQNIRLHLSKLIDDRQARDMDAPVWSPPGSRGAMASRHSRSAATLSFEGNADHQRNCSIVADKLSRTQERWFTVKERRAADREKEHQRRARIWTSMAASEARVHSQQQDLVEVQKKRAFNNAQRRSEQQKTLKEMKREKERIWEAYYNKGSAMDATASQCSSRSASPGRAPSRGASAPALGLPPEEEEDDDIFRTTLRSHTKYNDQMDQWRQFVIENDRRTDMQWKKIMQGGSKIDLIGELASDKLKRKMKAVAVGNSLGSALLDMSSERQKQAQQQAQQDLLSAELRSPGSIEASMSQQADSIDDAQEPQAALMKTSTSFASQDELRGRRAGERAQMMAKVKAQREVLIQTKAEAASGVFSRLEAAAEKRAQKREEDRKRRLKNDNYAVLSAEAEARRKEAEKALLAKFSQEMEEKNERTARALEKQRTGDHRAKRGDDWSATSAKCKAARQAHYDARSAAAARDLEKLTVAALERQTIREAERQRRLEMDNYDDRAADCQERRREAHKAAHEKTKKEIAMKAQKVLERQRNQGESIIAKERKLRKERSRAGTPAATRETSSLLPLINETVPMSPIRPTLRQQGSGNGTPADSEESEAEGEAEFLKELGKRSGEWLQELRRNQKIVAF